MNSSMSKKICVVTKALSRDCKVTKYMAFKGRCEIVRGFKVDTREHKIYLITFTIKRILTARQRQRDRSALPKAREREDDRSNRSAALTVYNT